MREDGAEFDAFAGCDGGASFVFAGGFVPRLLRLWSEAAVQEQAAMPRCEKSALGSMRVQAAKRGVLDLVAGESVQIFAGDFHLPTGHSQAVTGADDPYCCE